MEELLENDEFIQYIVNEYFAISNMTSHEKIQNVFSSTEEFSMAMDAFKLNSIKKEQ
ncbi:MAG: hypothetical protein OQL19_02240 [Gammaproteobacteria bacterium]|nr:hypothetical protein [Gammaproteobacteria bacterium]